MNSNEIRQSVLPPLRSLGAYLKAAGVGRGLGALSRGLVEARRADPFAELGAPRDERERRSRAQAAPAVTIYRALLRTAPREVALSAMAHIIEAGALAFLAKTLPDVTASSLSEGAPAARRAHVGAWMGRFFTATSEVTEVSERRVVFEVHACALVRLVSAVGHPELAPLFCKGDETFFRVRGIRLDRPTTLARGDTRCRFELTRET
jgi:predicted thioesterase